MSSPFPYLMYGGDDGVVVEEPDDVLVTLAWVKSELSIDEENTTSDEDLVEYIIQASDYIRRVTRQHLSVAEHVEEFRGTMMTRYTLRQRPAVNISLLECESGLDDWTTIPSSEYRLRAKRSGQAHEIYYPGYFNGRGTYRVTYTAGYDPIPGTVTWVATEMVKKAYHMKKDKGGILLFVDSVTKNTPAGSETTHYVRMEPVWEQRLQPFKRL